MLRKFRNLDKVETLHDAIMRLTNDNERLKQDNERLKQDNENSKKDLAVSEKRRIDKDEQIGRLEWLVEDTAGQRDYYFEKAGLMKLEVSDSKKEVKERDKLEEKLVKDCVRFYDLTAELQEEVRALRQDVEVYQKEIKELKSENKVLKEVLEATKIDLAEWKEIAQAKEKENKGKRERNV